MQTKMLMGIVLEAQRYLEESWDDDKAKYSDTMEEALERAFSNAWVFDDNAAATDMEKDLALFLIRNAWNEVQDWAK